MTKLSVNVKSGHVQISSTQNQITVKVKSCQKSGPVKSGHVKVISFQVTSCQILLRSNPRHIELGHVSSTHVNVRSCQVRPDLVRSSQSLVMSKSMSIQVMSTPNHVKSGHLKVRPCQN